MIDSNIPRALRLLVETELERNEREIWLGMPKPAYFTPGSTGTFIFGIPWTAFAIFWTGGAAMGASQAGAAGVFSLFPLFGVPFVLIGCAMLSAPIWVRRKATRTVYVITNQRAITFEGGGRSTTIRSFPPEKLIDVYRREKANGTGDVIFKHDLWKDSDGDKQNNEVGFFRIPDVKEVERKIKDLANGGSK